ncbi:hypothetical protein NC653_036241 [Populus alba x Populus x berolinensis]|uniref:Uncharacterized protein n=1 Tax=Populus alba x Populus x berolinensis TaxID=444605 RepID=A0AAD6LJL1_9ROSI|nr:hypothetical protein NC653_036241 [Populus alba x Populus x berolinensis]
MAYVLDWFGSREKEKRVRRNSPRELSFCHPFTSTTIALRWREFSLTINNGQRLDPKLLICKIRTEAC